MSTDGDTGTSDATLMARFLEKIRGLSDREAAKPHSPFSHAAIAKWRSGDWKRLEAKTRREIHEWLGVQPAITSPTYADGYSQAIQDVRDHLDALEARLPPKAKLPSDPENTAGVSGRARPTVSPAERPKKVVKRNRGE